MLRDVTNLLSEISNVLNDDGEVWLSVQWDKGDGFNPLAHQGMNQYTSAQFTECAHKAGFEVTRMDLLDEAYFMPTKDDKWIAIPYIMSVLKKAN